MSFRFHDAAKRLAAKRLSSETTRHRLNASAMQPDWFASCQSGVINIVMFVYLIEFFWEKAREKRQSNYVQFH